MGYLQKTVLVFIISLCAIAFGDEKNRKPDQADENCVSDIKEIYIDLEKQMARVGTAGLRVDLKDVNGKFALELAQTAMATGNRLCLVQTSGKLSYLTIRK